MNDLARIVLPYPPSVNSSYRHRKDGQVHLADGVRKWRTAAGWTYKAAGGKLLLGAIAMEVDLYPPDNGRRCDIDNGLKSLLDAFNGVAYKDDEQVAVLVVSKLYRDGLGRVEVTVKKMARGGVAPGH